MDLTVNQPNPTPQPGQPAIVDLVIADLHTRKTIGISRYGVALQARNGRDALRDLYEEISDALLYLRQLIEERDQADAEVEAECCCPILDLTTVAIDPGGQNFDAVRGWHPGCPAHGLTTTPPRPAEPTPPLPPAVEEPLPAAEPAPTTPVVEVRKPEVRKRRTDPTPALSSGPECVDPTCQHPADRHASHHNRSAVGCEDCRCVRSKERVMKQAQIDTTAVV